jgi:Phasin protein
MTELNRSEGLASGIAPGGAVTAGVLREAEAWSSAQCELLSGMGALWAEWMKRQREAIDASARSLQQMSECRNFADLVHLQQQWFAEAARRGASDISSWASDAVALTCRVAGAERAGTRGLVSAARGRASAKSGEEAPLQRAAAE